MNLKYGLCLLGAAALGLAMMAWLYGNEGASRKPVALFAPLAVCFGFVGARVVTLVFSFVGACASGPLFSLEPTLYAMSGAVLGVTGACALAARRTGVSFGELADALAPAGMLTIALARCAEVFAEFGAGPAFEVGPQFFPLSVQHADGTWHMCVFLLEAMFAFAALAYALGMRTSKPGERFVLTFAFWAAAQVLCESFRETTINLGFMGVQQVLYMAAVLAVMGVYAKILAEKPYKKKEPTDILCWITVIECVAAVVLMEYAIDHWVLPAALDYLIMAMALCGVFLPVRLVVRRALRNEEIPWKEQMKNR